MLIQCYGLFWKAEDVDWGVRGRGNIGTLWGVKMPAGRGKPVDFRKQSGVYVLYNDYGVVYVGQVGSGQNDLFTRLRQHRQNQLAGRWNKFSWFGTRWVKDDGELSAVVKKVDSTHAMALKHIEAVLIYATEPKKNRQGGPFGSDVTQYLQHLND